MSNRPASCLAIACCVVLAASAARAGSFPYPVVDTRQSTCYDTLVAIACRPAGQAFHGQDAQLSGIQPRYAVSADALTVTDDVTGLTWQRSPDTNGDGSITKSDKLTWTQAQAWPATLNAAHYGGYGDWRLPTIKELYSLIDFRGTDPSGYSGTDTSVLTPFIDTNYFRFAYGQTSQGERVIDSQYASSTVYVHDPSASGYTKLFGVNFADGRIKGYDLVMPGGSAKTFFVQCVRGSTSYGANDFVDNGDDTITDLATDLMWARPDCGTGLNWQAALAWVEARNTANYLGHSDWRLPNAKELQSIVDYTRAPDVTSSPSIDPLFSCTQITNEAGQPDWPCFWTGTTHAAYSGMGGAGIYVAFGRAMGYMGGWRDVHGAGAQRSDPKSGNPADYPYGRGPQGDAIRIYNHVRLVRDANLTLAVPSQGSSLLPNSLGVRGNPGRGSVTVRLWLARDAAGDLSVYDVNGRRVATLERGLLRQGQRNLAWGGTTAGGSPAPAGIYYVRLVARHFTRTAKFTLLR